MNPKVEVVKLNLQKKGQQVGTFSARVSFEGGFEAVYPGMRIVEGSKGIFVDLPSRKFKEVGFVPFYYLNKALRDLVTQKALEEYRKAASETTLAPKPASPMAMATKPTATAQPKTWPRKEWKPGYVKK